MECELANRSVVVTGAASGIGRACARAFAAEGAVLALLDADPAGADLASELGASARFVRTDVTDESQVAAAMATAVEHAGGVDVLCGCAGISGPFGTGVEEISLADWNQVLAVNTTGQFLLVKHGVPHLRRSKQPAIVFIASDAAFVAAPGMTPYNASKGALSMFTRALAVDLGEDGIRANCVCPSVVDTPLSRGDLDLPSGFDGQPYPVQRPEEVGAAAVYLASPMSKAVNGVSLLSDFGYHARSGYPA